MSKKSLHAVGRGIFQMEEAKTMEPDDSNESRHSLPMCVGNDKRVDRKNKANSDCSVNVVNIYAMLRVLMIWANCFFLLTCLFFLEK